MKPLVVIASVVAFVAFAVSFVPNASAEDLNYCPGMFLLEEVGPILDDPSITGSKSDFNGDGLVCGNNFYDGKAHQYIDNNTPREMVVVPGYIVHNPCRGVVGGCTDPVTVVSADLIVDTGAVAD